MEKIEAFGKAIANKEYDKYSRTLLSAYCKALLQTSNELIDISECIWAKDVKTIAQSLKKVGIDSFTISSTFSGLPEVLMAFQEEGFAVRRMVLVETGRTDWETDKPEIVPAILLSKE